MKMGFLLLWSLITITEERERKLPWSRKIGHYQIDIQPEVDAEETNQLDYMNELIPRTKFVNKGKKLKILSSNHATHSTLIKPSGYMTGRKKTNEVNNYRRKKMIKTDEILADVKASMNTIIKELISTEEPHSVNDILYIQDEEPKDEIYELDFQDPEDVLDLPVQDLYSSDSNYDTPELQTIVSNVLDKSQKNNSLMSDKEEVEYGTERFIEYHDHSTDILSEDEEPLEYLDNLNGDLTENLDIYSTVMYSPCTVTNYNFLEEISTKQINYNPDEFLDSGKLSSDLRKQNYSHNATTDDCGQDAKIYNTNTKISEVKSKFLRLFNLKKRLKNDKYLPGNSKNNSVTRGDAHDISLEKWVTHTMKDVGDLEKIRHQLNELASSKLTLEDLGVNVDRTTIDEGNTSKDNRFKLRTSEPNIRNLLSTDSTTGRNISDDFMNVTDDDYDDIVNWNGQNMSYRDAIIQRLAATLIYPTIKSKKKSQGVSRNTINNEIHSRKLVHSQTFSLDSSTPDTTNKDGEVSVTLSTSNDLSTTANTENASTDKYEPSSTATDVKTVFTNLETEPTTMQRSTLDTNTLHSRELATTESVKSTLDSNTKAKCTCELNKVNTPPNGVLNPAFSAREEPSSTMYTPSNIQPDRPINPYVYNPPQNNFNPYDPNKPQPVLNPYCVNPYAQNPTHPFINPYYIPNEQHIFSPYHQNNTQPVINPIEPNAPHNHTFPHKLLPNIPNFLQPSHWFHHPPETNIQVPIDVNGSHIFYTVCIGPNAQSTKPTKKPKNKVSTTPLQPSFTKPVFAELPFGFPFQAQGSSFIPLQPIWVPWVPNQNISFQSFSHNGPLNNLPVRHRIASSNFYGDQQTEIDTPQDLPLATQITSRPLSIGKILVNNKRLPDGLYRNSDLENHQVFHGKAKASRNKHIPYLFLQSLFANKPDDQRYSKRRLGTLNESCPSGNHKERTSNKRSFIRSMPSYGNFPIFPSQRIIQFSERYHNFLMERAKQQDRKSRYKTFGKIHPNNKISTIVRNARIINEQIEYNNLKKCLFCSFRNFLNKFIQNSSKCSPICYELDDDGRKLVNDLRTFLKTPAMCNFRSSNTVPGYLFKCNDEKT